VLDRARECLTDPIGCRDDGIANELQTRQGTLTGFLVTGAARILYDDGNETPALLTI